MVQRRLAVKLDHIATLRQLRRTKYPDPAQAAVLAELAQADQVIVHLREDRKHIQERDLRVLRDVVQTELNLRIPPTQEMLKIAYDVRPNRVTLVPDERDDLLDSPSLDLNKHRESIRKYVGSLHDGDIAVAVFIEPDLEQVRSAHKLEIQRVELRVSKYAAAMDAIERKTELQKIADAARTAGKVGMGVSVGHGLHHQNIAPLVPIEDIDEYAVGHGLVARAVLVGMERAVTELRQILNAP